METTLNDINLSQDALTVFINQHSNNSAMIESIFEKLFDSQQYIYMNNVHPTGEELFKILSDEINDYNAILPGSERITVCYYLPLLDLTMEWIDIFYKTVEELNKRHPISNMINHHFMICFSYSTQQPLGGKKEELCQLMCKLMTDNRGNMVSHQLYLLRQEGFHPLDSQEQGLVQLLHVLSRRDYSKVDRIADSFITYLKMINYSDYYQDQAIICNRKLEEIQQWGSEQKDPGLANVFASVQFAVQEPVKQLADTIRMFRKRACLYPVSSTEYKGNPITGYKRQSTNNRILNRRQEEFVSDSREKLAASVNLSETVKMIENELFYKDYLELQQLIEDGSMHQKIISCVNGIPAAGSMQGNEAEIFADMIYERVRAIAQKEIGNLEKKRKDMELRKRRYQKDLAEAGRYQNLRDCFDHIFINTSNILINGISPVNQDDIALINNKCGDEWMENGYEISGVQIAYRYDPISPCEIVLLKEFDMINLASEDAMTRLDRMFD